MLTSQLIQVNFHFSFRFNRIVYLYSTNRIWILEPTVYEDFRQSGTCRLSIAKQGFFEVNLAFALPKNSPLKLFLDKK
jgi:hypothetical protein